LVVLGRVPRAWVAEARPEGPNPVTRNARITSRSAKKRAEKESRRRHGRVHQSGARAGQDERREQSTPRGLGRRLLRGAFVPGRLLRRAGGGGHLQGEEVGLGPRIAGRRGSVRGVRDQPYHRSCRGCRSRRSGSSRWACSLCWSKACSWGCTWPSGDGRIRPENSPFARYADSGHGCMVCRLYEAAKGNRQGVEQT
jgi:hypothetical protein